MTIDGWNALLLLLVLCGNVLVWVGIFNRAHAVQMRRGTITWLHRAHNLGISAGSLALLIYPGLTGPRVVWGGPWREVPVLLQIYMAFCLCVALVWAVSFIWRALTPLPPHVLSMSVEKRDLGRELGGAARGAGPYQFMQHVPWNQYLHLEIVQLELSLDRLPAELDGLSIVQISDLHLIGTVELAYFERLFELAAALKGDLAVCTGDVIDNPALLDWLDSTFGRLQAPLGNYFVLGNHDSIWGRPAETRQRLKQHHWIDAAAGCITLSHRNAWIAIAGNERPWMGVAPDWQGAPAGAFRLLLSHTPDNISEARRDNVDLMLAGHTHGGQVRLPLIGPVYSPSRHGVKFASGTFWADPTLMHVSRGVAGRHPWRWNCLPELTRITLRRTPAR